MYEQTAYEQAKSIGFDYELGEPVPTKVYVFDYTKKQVKSYNVTEQFNPFTGEQYITSAAAVELSVSNEWSNIVNVSNSFFSDPFVSTFNGYDYLLSTSVRNAVHQQILNNWYGVVLGMSSMVLKLDNVIGIIPDSLTGDKLVVTFADNLELTLKLKDPNKAGLNRLLDAQLEYQPDSAYYVDEDGNVIKIPDDVKEWTTPMQRNFDSDDALNNFTGYMLNWGFVISGSSINRANMSCTKVVHPATDTQSERVVLTCTLTGG
ncbi:hypothetical protein [Thalassotalea profundi]|nr:hypothetical protein [Thalassotalea profundi]